MKLSSAYRQIEYFFGNVKFAVVIISVFTICLIYGTFMESFHGADYANRLVYKSTFFIFIQFLMLLSIIFATLIRLPPKKMLYGFYTIHLGLILLFLGSFITYNAGIDGTLSLNPNLPNRNVVLNDDIFIMEIPMAQKEVSLELPFVAGPTTLDLNYETIQILDYLPFAKKVISWNPSQEENIGNASAHFRLNNPQFTQDFYLSLNPQSDFKNTLQLGPLNIHYMPEKLFDCFQNKTSDFIIWNISTELCEKPLKETLLTKSKTIKGQVLKVQLKDQEIRFIPELSPLPLSANDTLDLNQNFRVFNQKLFENSPHLFVFSKDLAFYDKNIQKWVSVITKDDEPVELPWMGFKISLLKFSKDSFPKETPQYIKPIQENSSLIEGDLRALKIKTPHGEFWVDSYNPLSLEIEGNLIHFKLTKKTVPLPYEITLNQFKMDTDPGTNNPASYESFVSVFTKEGSEKHHVFMNNPLKKDQFTFYQASYFEAQEGGFGSVLSVNFDPGRFWKYLGSLLLVLGSIWHFYLRKKKVKTL